MDEDTKKKALADAGVGVFSEAMGGLYVGITNLKVRLFLKPVMPPSRLTWEEAIQWAKSLGDNVFLPSMDEAQMLMDRLPEEVAHESRMWTDLSYEGGISRALSYYCTKSSDGSFTGRTAAMKPETKLHARAVVRIETANREKRT